LDKVVAFEAAIQAAKDKVKFYVPNAPIIGVNADNSKSLFSSDNDLDNARIEGEEEDEVHEIIDDDDEYSGGGMDLMQQFTAADSPYIRR
jgi:hypothetical protein